MNLLITFIKGNQNGERKEVEEKETQKQDKGEGRRERNKSIDKEDEE